MVLFKDYVYMQKADDEYRDVLGDILLVATVQSFNADFLSAIV